MHTQPVMTILLISAPPHHVRGWGVYSGRIGDG